MIDAKVHSLFTYPVKSLAGIELSSSTLSSSGLQHDRQWAIFRDDHHPLTQRKNPRMVLIQPKIDASRLTLSAKGFGNISVSDSDFDERGNRQERSDNACFIWRDTCYTQGQLSQEKQKGVSQWLCDVLKEPQNLSLAKVDTHHPRKFIHPERFNVQASYFSDAAPYLIVNQGSLDALNQRCRKQDLTEVDIRHFRPNIVIEGIEAFSEHQFSSMQVKGAECLFRLVDHCQRCAMITVQPDTGEYLPKAHPFKTLAQLNSMPNTPKAPAFGVNACVINPGSNASIRVGQSLNLAQ
ncbi:MAG: MOSC domain-containing protein [Agarilytica sp.]